MIVYRNLIIACLLLISGDAYSQLPPIPFPGPPYQSTLCVVNQTQQPVTLTTTVAISSDWANSNSNRPDVDFNNVSIPRYSSLCAQELLNTTNYGGNISPATGAFTTTATSYGGATLTFSVQQSQALSQAWNTLQTSGTSTSVAWQWTGYNTNSVYLRYPNPPDNSSWMASLADSQALNSLVLPGTHDSGMYTTQQCNVPSIYTMSQYSTSDFSQQLKDGIRYFDIRPYVYGVNGVFTYVTGHFSSALDNNISFGCFGGSLTDILNEVNKFLAANQTEFVILKFSHTEESLPSSVLPTNAVTCHSRKLPHSSSITLPHKQICHSYVTYIRPQPPAHQPRPITLRISRSNLFAVKRSRFSMLNTRQHQRI